MSNLDQNNNVTVTADKIKFTANSGKKRNKREASLHLNHFDPNCQTKKILKNLINNHKKRNSKPTAEGASCTEIESNVNES